jgi:Tol biopolymer transport system component
VLSLLWLAGAVLLGGYVLARSLWLWRAVKRERPITDQQILDLLEDCKMQMGVQTILGVVVTNKIKSPALFGFVRPRLLLPQGLLEGLSLDELQHVFLHELAHLRRGDIYIGWWTAVLQVLHWFNPLIWFAFRQVRADQEMACDALALSRMTPEEPPAYGRTIVNLLERFSQPQYVPSVAGILEDTAHIKRRMTMIARFNDNSYRWSPLPVILIVAVGCASLSDVRRGAPTDATVAEVGPVVTLRKMQLEHGDFANVSPDGRYLCDEDWDSGNLVIRELSTGRRWPVTGKASWDDSDDYTLWAAISPDSRRVAYLWHDSVSDSSNLYVVGLDGTNRRLLCRDKHVAPKDWSADGTKILGVLYEESRQLVWVDAQDGSLEMRRDLGDANPNKFDVSPDGRFIAFDHPQTVDTTQRDVFLLDLRENREKRIAEHPANDRLLGWTPNGKWILFASNRSGKWDAWLLGMRNGMPVGNPRLVKANIGDVGAVGFASDGDYYFSIYDLRRHVYVAQFDPAAGRLLSLPVRLQPTDASCEPVWSPDGQRIAYACKGDDGTSLIKIRSLASGQEREFAPDLPKRLHFWAPDGKSLLLCGFLDEEWYNAVYTLDLETGECTELLRHKDMSIPIAQWFPDGKRLLYHGRHGPIGSGSGSKLGYLMARDMESGEEREESGEEREIARGLLQGMRDYGWALSPDGRRLAVRFEGDNRSIKVFSTEEDAVKEILTGDLVDKPQQILWAPDGKDLLLRVVDLEVSSTSTLWRVAADGGKPAKLCELSDIPDPEYVMGMRIDPTGRHIALQAITNLHELWVMENFLPEEVASVGK